jgi:uncharacterized protein YcaQ
MSDVLQKLRRHAVLHSLFEPTTLGGAVHRLGFVQADPIRAPARAQDLTLRHRVAQYRVGDLERHYGSLDVEEDYLYAYGFVPRSVWRLLHPRQTGRLSALESKVLDIVRNCREMHPAELESHLGRRRVINAWGGYSKATTAALEKLHYRGAVRIARRENGIRVYEVAMHDAEPVSPSERLRQLILTVAGTLAPVSERTLRSNMARFSHLGNPHNALEQLKRIGALHEEALDGVNYLWPPCEMSDVEPQAVRFLAPFDPVAWDRNRFEHFWGWAYRFEAYTPVAKRVRGYYALPLLWRDQIIGWVNARVSNGQLHLDIGFIGKRLTDRRFRSELEAEGERIKQFLKLGAVEVEVQTTPAAPQFKVATR